MLRTNLLTFSAFDTVRCLAIRSCMNHIVIVICVPVMADLLRIHRRKQIRNGDMFRTAICAITAGGTQTPARQTLCELPIV